MIETRFKETEIGSIPEGWAAKILGDFFEIGSSKRVMQYQWKSQGIPFLRAREIVSLFNNTPFSQPIYISETLYNSLKELYGVPAKGDILVTGVGTLGIPYVVKGYKPFYYKDGNLICLHNMGSIVSKYIYYQLLYPIVKKQIENTGAGSTVGTFTIDKARTVIFPCPDYEEQQKIADALTSVDELISGIKELIEKKRSIKEGAMSELLTGRKRLPGFNEPWTECILSDISTYGQEMLPTDIFEDTTYVCTENMISNFGGVEPYLDVCAYSYVKNYVPGDILLSNIRPYLKKLWLSPTSGGCSTDVLIIRPDYNKVNPSFLYQILSDDSFFNYIMTGVSGTKMPRGNKYQIMKFQLCIPAIEEQQAIAYILTSMDAEIEALENKLHKYEQIKQGMMQQLLTGKIRLI